ncbi:MAG: chemotaxis protein histidine kinase CheA, partial [bacterium]
HNIEAGLEDVRSGKKPLTKELIETLIHDTKELQQILNDNLDRLGNLISEEDRSQTELIYRVPSAKLTELKQRILQKIPKEKWLPIQNAIDDLKKEPIGRVLKKYAVAAENLADQLNKKIQVRLHGESTLVSYERLESLFSTLIHLVRNSVDHGLEESDMRPMLGKDEVGTIDIHASISGRNLKLVIADDGGGIDHDIIKGIALKKGIIDESFAEKASKQEIIPLIFAAGFSTKENVSEISGRGVGMDAVKYAVAELKGRIRVKTEIDEGTTFELIIPNVA